MRRRLISALTVLALASGTTFVAPAPARAAAAVNPATIAAIYAAAKKIYGYWKDLKSFLDSGGHNGLSVDDATRLIINEIATTRQQILDQMASIATADVRACATHHVIEFADIENFTPQLLQQWAQDATACVTRITSLYTALPPTNYVALNDLGNALAVVGPIALVARTRAGFSTAALTDVLVQGFTRVVQTFTPFCYDVPDGYNYADEQWPSYPMFISTSYVCVAPGSPNVPGTSVAYGTAWWQINVYLDQQCQCSSSIPDWTNIGGVDLVAQASELNSRTPALDALTKLRP
jgi:hypothetical protein